MAVDVYFRNPDNYIRECVEIDAHQLAWDRGYLVKRSIEPNRFADLYFPTTVEYRMLAVGEQGTAELTRGHGLEDPVAVYPTWEYGEDTMDVLVDMLANPAGEDARACSDPRTPIDERPVYGQKHMVVITRPPNAGTGVGRKFFRILSELQDEFPEAHVHVHGIYSYRVMFGLNFKSVDFDPRSHAAKGKVVLPNGKQCTHEMAGKTPQWVNVIGFHCGDLKVPRNRCMFNMKAAWWAAEHYAENFKFKARGTTTVDPMAPAHIPATTSAVKTVQAPATVADKFLCDTCSLRDSCKYFRPESVCSIPGSETAPLTKLFRSRDAEDIMNGLGDVLAGQAERLASGMQGEEFMGELDPEVTRIAAMIMNNGAKLAKLRNPALAAAGAPRVNIGVINGQPVSPNAIAAQMVAELESRGFTRDQITPDLIMREFGQQQAAIEASSAEVPRDGD